MHSRLLSSILSFLALIALVPSYPAASLHPRQDSSLSDPPIAGIFATVKSSTGTDITSNFQTLFFDGTAIDAVSNLTERQVTNLIRPINFCRNIAGDFRYSECTYRAHLRHSLQHYRVRCKIPNTPGGVPSQLFVFEVVSFASLLQASSLLERFRRVQRALLHISFFNPFTKRRTRRKRDIVTRTKSALTGPRMIEEYRR